MIDVLSPFLSGLFAVLLERIARPELVRFFLRNQLDEELLEKLKLLFLSASTVLSDFEEKQFLNPLVKEWVDGLEDAAYKADDVLDEIFTKADLEASTETVSTDIIDCVKGGVKVIAAVVKLGAGEVKTKIDGIIERLESILGYKDLILKEGGVGKSWPLVSSTTSLVDERTVFGMNSDKEKIIDFLLSDCSVKEGVPLVAIVGMGGLGKTTLAQIVYNDKREKDHFHRRSWVCVSHTSNLDEITKRVFESLTLSGSDISELNTLQIKLKNMLAGQKILLVLDGYWNDDFLEWDVLVRPFLSRKCGNKIIVTTRNFNVATAIRANLTHSLPFLSDKDAWDLFSFYAFRSGSHENPILAHIGEKIVGKCNGLPLAVKTLGSLLRCTDDVGEWEGIRIAGYQSCQAIRVASFLLWHLATLIYRLI